MYSFDISIESTKNIVVNQLLIHDVKTAFYICISIIQTKITFLQILAGSAAYNFKYDFPPQYIDSILAIRTL